MPTTKPKTQPESAASDANFEHERLLSLINSMVDGVIAVDEQGKVDIYNGAALSILDLNSTIAGKHLSTLCTIEDSNNQPVDIGELVKSADKAFISRDYRICYVDGSKVNLYISIAPVHLGYGKTAEQSHVIVLRDISHEKSLEEERDEFISVVSHELRTPIAIAEGNISNAQLVMDKNSDQSPASIQIKKALSDAHQQTLFLGDMINDLSTLSRAEHGTLTADTETINMHDLLTELARAHTTEAEAKGLKLYSHLDPKLELLMSSKLYVREVLQNFITNAIKYTDSGHITISATQDASGVTVGIADTGIGISKSDQEKIYDKFFRSENYETRKTNGTGLGLYVTVKLARLLHANIETKSVLGKGSKFTIFFPNLK